MLQIGKVLYSENLVGFHSGNISMKISEAEAIITRHDAPLGYMTESDLITVRIEENEKDVQQCDPTPSSELDVHLEAYRQTKAGAVIHAHPLIATVLSLHMDMITPIDMNAQYYLKEIPVVHSTLETNSSQEIKEKIIEKMKNNVIIMVSGHGCFASGKDIEEVCKYLTIFEHACKILYYSILGWKNNAEN